MISGANCCDWKDIYWFSGERGPFSDRKLAKVTFSFKDDPKYGKIFGTPHVVDWDDDGNQDIVMSYKNDFWIQSSSKKGHRGTTNQWKFKPIEFKFETSEFGRYVDLKDYNGDGRVDLLYTRESPGVILLRLNQSTTGEPSFAPPLRLFEAPDDWKINSITAVDLDQDGQMEISCGVYKITEAKPNQGWKYESELWLLDR